MCYCDYGPASVYVVTQPVARKVHRCHECYREVIQPGERYERVFAVWDGNAETYKTCARCLDLRNFVTERADCCCWAHGNMREDCIEAARYQGWADTDSKPGLLFGAYRREVLIQRARSRVGGWQCAG